MTLGLLCLLLALVGIGAKQRAALAVFLEKAPEIQRALEKFADEHQGGFPPDAMHSARPQGLGEDYINWKSNWRIDYDVHDNGRGGKFVCLEFRGVHDRYEGLCQVAEYRGQYGQGQEIPGKVNRIWLIREEAEIISEKSGF